MCLCVRARVCPSLSLCPYLHIFLLLHTTKMQPCIAALYTVSCHVTQLEHVLSAAPFRTSRCRRAALPARGEPCVGKCVPMSGGTPRRARKPCALRSSSAHPPTGERREEGPPADCRGYLAAGFPSWGRSVLASRSLPRAHRSWDYDFM